jgi:hypothetical protein
MTRIAACWRKGERYVVRDIDGREITDAEGRAICAERYKVTAEVRAARRRTNKASQQKKGKKGTSRRRKESTAKAAPAADPSLPEAIENVA